MKKYQKFRIIAGIGIASLIMIFAPQGYSQSENPGPRIGIKGGVNFSQFFVDQPTVDDENMKMGLHFGIFTKIAVTDFLAIQPELLYTSLGSKVSYGGSDVESLLGIREGEVRFNLNYIQLPIGLAFNLGPLNINAGPYLSYLVSANVKNLQSSDLSTSDPIELDKDDFNTFDYGVFAGLGFDIGNVTIGARYNHGLREVGAAGLGGTLTNNSRNAVAQIFLGFGF